MSFIFCDSINYITSGLSGISCTAFEMTYKSQKKEKTKIVGGPRSNYLDSQRLLTLIQMNPTRANCFGLAAALPAHDSIGRGASTVELAAKESER